jgi:ketosteroid isomerase-like protein
VPRIKEDEMTDTSSHTQGPHSGTNAWDDVEIRRLLEGRQQAHHRKDPAAIAAVFAADAVRYDLAPPLVHIGADRGEIAAWLATWKGPILIDTRDLEIEVDGSLAVAHGVTRMRGHKIDDPSREVDFWFRTTVVLKKMDARWQIVHEHASVPFYMDGSLRAAVDLKPETATRH